MNDACLHALDDLLELPLLRTGHALDQYLCLFCVLVFEKGNLTEDLIDFLLVKDKVFSEHLLELEFLMLGLFAFVTAHPISIIIKQNSQIPH